MSAPLLLHCKVPEPELARGGGFVRGVEAQADDIAGPVRIAGQVDSDFVKFAVGRNPVADGVLLVERLLVLRTPEKLAGGTRAFREAQLETDAFQAVRRNRAGEVRERLRVVFTGIIAGDRIALDPVVRIVAAAEPAGRRQGRSV